MFFLSFPRRVAFWVAGPEEAKNLGGAKGLRLIQIRWRCRAWKKSAGLARKITRCESHPLQFR
jgi:hypothetical protein